MLLSIITVNYNNAIGLRNTIESVLNQSFRDFEYIIVDGGSTDESLDVIRYFDQSKFKWISEKDKGIYDAMNKGISFASGEYLIFLNSGDCLAEDKILEFLVEYLGSKDIVYGDLIDVSRIPPQRFAYSMSIDINYMIQSGLPHQASAIRKKLFDKIGVYNTSYKIISDWAFFMLALFKHGASYKYVGKVICNFEGGGISSRKDYLPQIITEYRHFMQKYFPESLNLLINNNVMVQKFLKGKSRLVRWYYRLKLTY